ncbi:Phage-Associated Protein [Strawberry lethal yellows phytoplasma (CPA) str. NZSb11]|uniref:Phage-Associated Protein n=2 Tax=Phytoplasma australiense TaxID=59748 RepID=R4RNC4_PHYAS|nr:Phage-Associated Protein [Strawberry lethal yellows phytoplasma (CPA) str. NZSb11]AGL90875.1 Phage-Associated Protein [Strawberry lethal yellows phytoplasma (CPA) str. NZSb11]
MVKKSKRKINKMNQTKQINVFDVALYIVKNNPSSTTKMKLNKMIYYAHAKHLVQTKKPLLKEQIQAWIYGPVFPELCKQLKDFTYQPINPEVLAMGDITKINATQKQILDFMIWLYGDASPNDLSSQTHMEHPWIKSYYKDYDSGWSKKIIKNKDILEYFSENNKNIGA